MKRQYPSMQELKNDFGNHKEIPAQYEDVILRTLFHYPELRDVKITFRLKHDHADPYEVVPSVKNAIVLKKSYIVTLLEKADEPVSKALFKNLPEEAQMGILGHLFSHIVQCEKKKLPSMLKFATSSPGRKMEREADILTIEHGLGFELYTFACYIRGIPGYMEERRQFDVNHLHPNEILEAMPPGQLQEVR